jgi:hypothetical protein
LLAWFKKFNPSVARPPARRTALLSSLRAHCQDDDKDDVASEVEEEEKLQNDANNDAATDFPFAFLKALAKEHNVAGQSKAKLLRIFREKDFDLESAFVAFQAKGGASAPRANKRSKEMEGNDDEEKEETTQKKKLKEPQKKKKGEKDDDWGEEMGKKKKRQRKDDDEEGDEDDGESEVQAKGKKQKVKKSKAVAVLPFDAGDLLSATMGELREYSAQVGAAAKKKEELLKELRGFLPQNEQWASSDDDWENITLPGTNEYGNIDVRDGLSAGLVHVLGLVKKKKKH